jgi:hypothetical protein
MNHTAHQLFDDGTGTGSAGMNGLMTHGSLVLDIYGADWLDAVFLDVNGTIADRFRIFKNASESATVQSSSASDRLVDRDAGDDYGSGALQGGTVDSDSDSESESNARRAVCGRCIETGNRRGEHVIEGRSGVVSTASLASTYPLGGGDGSSHSAFVAPSPAQASSTRLPVGPSLRGQAASMPGVDRTAEDTASSDSEVLIALARTIHADLEATAPVDPEAMTDSEWNAAQQELERKREAAKARFPCLHDAALAQRVFVELYYVSPPPEPLDR